MKREQMLTVLLVVLVIVSAVQAFQLVLLGGAVSSGTVAKTSTSAPASSGGSSPSVPSSIQNLPQMVGGC